MTDESASCEKPVKAKRSFCRLFSILILLIILAGLAYGYFQLFNVNSELASMRTILQTRVTNGQQDISGLQTKVDNLQQSMQKNQELSAQLEQLMTSFRAAQSGDMSKWHVAEAGYLLHMANDELQYRHNIKMAVQILQQADNELQTSQDAGLLEVRKSLATDIANLQALQPLDVTAIYLQLTALNTLIDKLPLPIQPLQQETSKDTPAKTDTWKAGLQSVWNGLNKVVIVRKNDASALPLVLPDEKIFLYQNLHAQLESASFGLLHENTVVYTTSLERARAWIQQYFVQDAEITKNVLQQLVELQKVNVQPETVVLTQTLQLFDNYLAQVKTAQ